VARNFNYLFENEELLKVRAGLNVVLSQNGARRSRC